ncbi:MAG: hypothetical protein SFX18_05085 [Pirellulales bacterium]|nr:hypothetical protein [Pirellulales bacterium]
MTRNAIFILTAVVLLLSFCAVWTISQNPQITFVRHQVNSQGNLEAVFKLSNPLPVALKYVGLPEVACCIQYERDVTGWNDDCGPDESLFPTPTPYLVLSPYSSTHLIVRRHYNSNKPLKIKARFQLMPAENSWDKFICMLQDSWRGYFSTPQGFSFEQSSRELTIRSDIAEPWTTYPDKAP